VRTGLSLALIAVVVHRGPARMRGCSDVISVRIHRRNVQIRGMIRPIEALAAFGVPWARENGEPDRPATEPAQGVSRHSALILA
jgi:hypothetical protein